MTSIRPRTQVSTDKLQAVQAPPTRIEGDKMHLDPEKVIKAWLDSAEVLRDVANAVRENQEDNIAVRTAVEKGMRTAVVASAVAIALHVVAVGTILWMNLDTHSHVTAICQPVGR